MRARAAALAVATLTGAAVLFAAVPAGAHSVLAASTPEAGETLTALPAEFSVTANETLLDLGGQGVFLLQIRDAAGAYYGDGCVRVVDATMSAEPAIGRSGDYTMLWQIVSADGHPVSGAIDFTWVAPDDFEPAAAHERAPVCGEDPDAAPIEEPSAEATMPPWVLPGAIGIGAVAVLAAVAVLVVRRTRRGDPAP